jgi:Kdo2-lipid IVA lauroyltransferase/acyltransferase
MASFFKRLQSELEYVLVKIIAFVAQRLSWKTAQILGCGLGYFMYRFVPIRKKVVIENLSRAFPEESQDQIHSIAKSTYENFGQTLFEFIKMPACNQKEILKVATFENDPLMAECHRKGKGTVCISGHFGNWELMAAAFAAKGFPMEAIAREQRNIKVDRLIQKHRNAVGVKTILLGMALRGVMRALRKNRFVAMLTDQDAHDEGVFVDFLGLPSSTAPGPASFALKSGAPLLFGAAIRKSKGHHKIILELVPFDDLDPKDPLSVKILTQRHATILEKYVRLYPDHWFWMHKRWKTKPSNKKNRATIE